MKPIGRLDSLENLFQLEVATAYSSEHALDTALATVSCAASSLRLKEAFLDHRSETQEQIRRLHEAFDFLDEDAEEAPCPGMVGFIAEVVELMQAPADRHVRDAALIAAAQKIEHHEIATYSWLCELAKVRGNRDHYHALHKCLDEEVAADRRLNRLAQGTFFSPGLNKRAQTEPAPEEPPYIESVA